MIDIKKLHFDYDKKKSVFSDLDLSLGSGKICGLLGKNGAGKTTLLKIICGLLFPQNGSCEILGFKPQKREIDFLKEIYILPEEFFTPAVTIKQFCNLYAPFYPRFNCSQFKKTLTTLELNHEQRLSKLSYGQKKKALLAFGLATNCKLFLLDEPTNGLDIPSKSLFRRLLAENFDDNRTFIISTHQVHDVENLIDHVTILDNGKIIFNKSSEDIISNYSFEQSSATPDKNAMYFEKTLQGFKILNKNKQNIETPIDLELLFNAVCSDKNARAIS